jgi:hypothetical protein
MDQARKVSGVTFQVHIYRTGSVPKGYAPGKVTIYSPIRAKVMEVTKAVDDARVAKAKMSDEVMVDDWSEEDNKAQDHREADNKAQDQVVAKSYSTTVGSTGFPMELARMMPGRFSTMWQNVPLFVVFTVLVWSGQWIYFHFDVVRARRLDYNSYLGSGFSNLIWLTVVVFMSFLIEAVVLHWRRYWPVPHVKDPYVVTEVDAVVVDEEAAYTKEELVKDTLPEPLQYEEHVGRPVFNELLDEPRRLATAPAIFTCGPVTMTNALRKEAQVGDSVGLTRFAVYEELFEM